MLRHPALLAMVAVAAAGCNLGSGPPANLLLVTVDTLRADRLGCYGHSEAETPNIDAIADQGILFERATAAVPVTLPSHASILTGTFPPTHGVRDNVTFQLSSDSLTLAEMLGSHGFQTGAFVGAFPLHRRFGLDQGFSYYDDQVGSQSDAPSGFFTERRAGEVVRAALDWISEAEPPFFAWVHLFDPHIPYDPPSPFAETFSDPYDGEVAYVDSELGKLWEGLEHSGHGDDTLIVFTSDHGESLREHGERSHGFFVYDATTHVPLIIKHPSLGEPRRIAGQVRLVDIMPTVLELFEVPVPEEIQGVSLKSAMAGEPVELPAYAESYVPLLNFHWSPLTSLTHQGWKYVQAPRPELYDLSRDPEEVENLIDMEPERAASLEHQLQELEARYSEESKLVQQRSPDEQTLRALQSLGYLGGGLPEVDDHTSLPDPKDQIHIWDLMEEELAYLTSERFPEAIEVLTKVLDQDPDNLLALEHYGYSLYHSNENQKAERAYRRLLELDPKRASAHVSYGSCLKRLGRRDEARQHFQQAQELDPTYAKAYLRMGTSLLEEGNAEAAQDQFQRVLELDPESAEARKGLARAYRQQSRFDRAEEIYRELAEEKPDAEALAELAEALLHQGQVPEAESALEESLQIDPSQWRALYVRSMILNRSGDEKGAGELLEQVTLKQPNFPRAHHDLGVIYAHRGDAKRAIASYQRAIELAPNALSYNGLGTVYARAANWQAAIDQFQKAIDMQPGYLTAYQNLAQAYLAAGFPDRAQETLKKLESLPR